MSSQRLYKVLKTIYQHCPIKNNQSICIDINNKAYEITYDLVDDTFYLFNGYQLMFGANRCGVLCYKLILGDYYDKEGIDIVLSGLKDIYDNITKKEDRRKDLEKSIELYLY